LRHGLQNDFKIATYYRLASHREIGIFVGMKKHLINTQKYPLDRLSSSEAQSLIDETRAKLQQDGSCIFPEFVGTKALSEILEQAGEILHLAYPGPTEVSPYFFNYRLGEGQDLPKSHPLLRKGKRCLSQVAADLIPQTSLLRQLYEDQMMVNFLGAVLDQPVYRNKDPYQSLNISVMNQGGCQQWHFDSGNMVTTLLLQEPDSGGEFEYAAAIRSDADENFEAVQSVLDGTRDQVKRIQLRAGTLSLFRGHYSLHRVTEVVGESRRIQAILGYTSKPELFGNKESSILHYGPRVAEIEAASPLYPD
jgi:hypothetical protein